MENLSSAIGLIRKIKNSLICPPEYVDGFKSETTRINQARLKVLSMFMCAMSSFMVIYLAYYYKINGFLTTRHAIALHAYNVFVALIFVFVIFWIDRDESRVEKFASLVHKLIVIHVLLFVVAFSLSAQFTTGQITVYVIGIVFVAIIAFLDPRFMAGLYIISNAIFLAMLPLFQPSAILRSSHAISTAYLILGAWTVSAILYNSRIKDHIQKKTIENQFQKLTELNSKFEMLSMIDPLTGANNRRKFDETLLSEWARAIRDKTPISIALADIDYFKNFNDKYGHIEGDECIKQVAKSIMNLLKRPGDSISRYGGEEFAIILPNTDLQGATILCESMRSTIEGLSIPNSGSEFQRVTVSMGVKSIVPVPGDSLLTFFTKVDEILYEAKKAGRNKVMTE